MPLTEEQIAERISYLGGSEAAAALGLSRWMTPLKLWAIKTGAILPDDLSDNQAVEMGNELEDAVARIFTKRTGKKLHRVNETIFHPKYPFLAANLDRRVVGADELVEIKTCSAWRAKEFENEEMPQEFLLQVMHYLAVTGKQAGYIAVLIGGQDFRWRKIERDEKLIADIVKREVHFWETFVIPKVMPATVTKNDGETLYSLFPLGDESEEIELGDDANRIIEGLEAMKADLRTLEGSIDREENALKAMLQDKAVGVTDKFRITWKNSSRITVDTKRLKEQRPDIHEEFSKQTSSRVLRIGPVKSEK